MGHAHVGYLHSLHSLRRSLPRALDFLATMKKFILALLTTIPLRLIAGEADLVSVLPGCLPIQQIKKTYGAIIDGHPDSTFSGSRVEVCGAAIAKNGDITRATATLTLKEKHEYSSDELISDSASSEAAQLNSYKYTLQLTLNDQAVNRMRSYTASGKPAIILVALDGKVIGNFIYAGQFTGNKFFADIPEQNAILIKNLKSP